MCVTEGVRVEIERCCIFFVFVKVICLNLSDVFTCRPDWGSPTPQPYRGNIFSWFFMFSFFYAYWQDILFYVILLSILLSSFHKWYGFTSVPLEINQLYREPMSRRMQVYHIPEKAFSSIDLF